MTLEALGLGVPAILDGYDPAISSRRRERLEDLGLIPGTALRVERRAPLGDPLALKVRGGLLCLRRSEARFIRVRPAPRPGLGSGDGRD